MCPGPQQGAATQQVDAPGHAACDGVDAGHGPRIEGQRPGVTRYREPVGDVVVGFSPVQRVEVVAGNDALRQLLQLGALEHGAQLGLADQHDLQQLALVGFQVGQQAQLLQHLGQQVLRLVDDEHAAFPGGVAGQQKGIQRVDVLLQAQGRGGGGCRTLDGGCVARALGAARLASCGDVELLADRLQQLADRQPGVEDVGHAAAGRNLLQKAAADGGFAGADVARQQHKATTRAARAAGPGAGRGHAVQQVCQRLTVALTHEQKTRIGRNGERVLRQAQVVRVHKLRAYREPVFPVCPCCCQ